MFNNRELWRHKNCLDIDVRVWKKIEETKDYTKMKVLYWNRHYKFFRMRLV